MLWGLGPGSSSSCELGLPRHQQAAPGRPGLRGQPAAGCAGCRLPAPGARGCGLACREGAERRAKLLVTHHVHPTLTWSSACRRSSSLGRGEAAGAPTPREPGLAMLPLPLCLLLCPRCTSTGTGLPKHSLKPTTEVVKQEL